MVANYCPDSAEGTTQGEDGKRKTASYWGEQGARGKHTLVMHWAGTEPPPKKVHWDKTRHSFYFSTILLHQPKPISNFAWEGTRIKATNAEICVVSAYS